MTVGLLALRVAAALFASAAIIHNYERYGPLGIVFVLLSWLVAFGVVMLGGPLLGAALHEHRVLTGAAQTPVAALGERGADDEPEAPRPPA
jgi:membrane protein